MKQTIIVGEGRALERADSTARERGLEHRVLELNAADRHNFDIAPLLERYPAAESEVFVALDERAVNYARHKLIADIRLAGYRLFDIVSPQAIVGEGVRLLGNVFVGAGCVLAGRARIGTGSWLELQVLVEEDCRVGTCSTLLAGV
ncbi:acetyltransferase [Pseudomonas aeruginosa]|nr:acetyltransferase [Pseudomonas aeruginosa]MCS8532451.1 acetyltransferase [Pseudomonas aeruginosa]MCS9848447.1 acetyltransferase [Pseudomonas aeruginosa]